MTVSIRADVTFTAAVIERADTGEIYRTPVNVSLLDRI